MQLVIILSLFSSLMFGSSCLSEYKSASKINKQAMISSGKLNSTYFGPKSAYSKNFLDILSNQRIKLRYDALSMLEEKSIAEELEFNNISWSATPYNTFTQELLSCANRLLAIRSRLIVEASQKDIYHGFLTKDFYYDFLTGEFLGATDQGYEFAYDD